MRKLLIGIGTVISITAPVVAVVSCSKDKAALVNNFATKEKVAPDITTKLTKEQQDLVLKYLASTDHFVGKSYADFKGATINAKSDMPYEWNLQKTNDGFLIQNTLRNITQASAEKIVQLFTLGVEAYSEMEKIHAKDILKMNEIDSNSNADQSDSNAKLAEYYKSIGAFKIAKLVQLDSNKIYEAAQDNSGVDYSEKMVVNAEGKIVKIGIETKDFIYSVDVDKLLKSFEEFSNIEYERLSEEIKHLTKEEQDKIGFPTKDEMTKSLGSDWWFVKARFNFDILNGILNEKTTA